MSKNPMSAKMLQASANALSAYACIKLFEKKPELKETYGDQAFDYWKNFLSQLLKDLSVALKEDKVALFRSKVKWEREAFISRRVDENLILDSLVCLDEVIDEELAETIGDAAKSFIQLAQKDFETSLDDDSALQIKDPVSRLAGTYLQKILEGDSHGAIAAVVQARQEGMSLEDSYLALTQAQSEVGRLWHVAELSIAEEHLVTHTTHQAMSVLNFQAERAKLNGKTLVSSAVEGNYHDLGIRAVTDFFEFDGWRVICLGHNSPADDIAEAARIFDAALVVLSATMSSHLDVTRRTINLLGERVPNCKVLLGGRVFDEFPELVTDLGGHGFAKSPVDAVKLGNQLSSS